MMMSVTQLVFPELAGNSIKVFPEKKTKIFCNMFHKIWKF